MIPPFLYQKTPSPAPSTAPSPSVTSARGPSPPRTQKTAAEFEQEPKFPVPPCLTASLSRVPTSPLHGGGHGGTSATYKTPRDLPGKVSQGEMSEGTPRSFCWQRRRQRDAGLRASSRRPRVPLAEEPVVNSSTDGKRRRSNFSCSTLLSPRSCLPTSPFT